MIEAAYRFARHEPGVDVVLFGTGDAAHLRTNVASLLKPPLPEADRAKLVALFGHLTGIGLDGHQAPAPRPDSGEDIVRAMIFFTPSPRRGRVGWGGLRRFFYPGFAEEKLLPSSRRRHNASYKCYDWDIVRTGAPHRRQLVQMEGSMAGTGKPSMVARPCGCVRSGRAGADRGDGPDPDHDPEFQLRPAALPVGFVALFHPQPLAHTKRRRLPSTRPRKRTPRSRTRPRARRRSASSKRPGRRRPMMLRPRAVPSVGQSAAGGSGEKEQRRPAGIRALALTSAFVRPARPYFARLPPAFGQVPHLAFSARAKLCARDCRRL